MSRTTLRIVGDEGSFDVDIATGLRACDSNAYPNIGLVDVKELQEWWAGLEIYPLDHRVISIDILLVGYWGHEEDEEFEPPEWDYRLEYMAKLATVSKDFAAACRNRMIEQEFRTKPWGHAHRHPSWNWRPDDQPFDTGYTLRAYR